MRTFDAYLDSILIIVVLSDVIQNSNGPLQVKGFSSPEAAKELLVFGIIPGSMISILRKSPFGDSYLVKVDERVVAMRKHEILALRF